MSKKIIIANIHNNQKVNDFTFFYIKSLNNPNITVLMEGVLAIKLLLVLLLWIDISC
jgi:hypothetical protein